MGKGCKARNRRQQQPQQSTQPNSTQPNISEATTADTPDFEALYLQAKAEKEALATEKEALATETSLLETVSAIATAFQTVLKVLLASPNCAASVSISKEAGAAAESACAVPISADGEAKEADDDDDDEAENSDGGIDEEALTEANKLAVANQREPAEGGSNGTSFQDFVGLWALPTPMDESTLLKQNANLLATGIKDYMSDPGVSAAYTKLKNHRQNEQKKTANKR